MYSISPSNVSNSSLSFWLISSKDSRILNGNKHVMKQMEITETKAGSSCQCSIALGGVWQFWNVGENYWPVDQIHLLSSPHLSWLHHWSQCSHVIYSVVCHLQCKFSLRRIASEGRVARVCDSDVDTLLHGISWLLQWGTWQTVYCVWRKVSIGSLVAFIILCVVLETVSLQDSCLKMAVMCWWDTVYVVG